MSDNKIVVYVKKFAYENLKRGEKKKAETQNGRAILKEAVFREYSIDTNDLKIEKGEHGKPYFSDRKDIFFNISHSGDYAAAAVGNVPLGVDVQVMSRVGESVIGKLCNDDEKRFLNESEDRGKAFIILWSLKESFVKATGDGMSFPMKNINFKMDNFRGEKEGGFSNRHGTFHVRDCGEYALAACALSESAEFLVIDF